MRILVLILLSLSIYVPLAHSQDTNTHKIDKTDSSQIESEQTTADSIPKKYFNLNSINPNRIRVGTMKSEESGMLANEASELPEPFHFLDQDLFGNPTADSEHSSESSDFSEEADLLFTQEPVPFDSLNTFFSRDDGSSDIFIGGLFPFVTVPNRKDEDRTSVFSQDALTFFLYLKKEF